MRMLVAGDLVPTQENEALFLSAGVERLLGEQLQSLWNTADYRKGDIFFTDDCWCVCDFMACN